MLRDIDICIAAGEVAGGDSGAASADCLAEQFLAAAASAERLYEIRYRSGAVALRLLLDAQENSRTAALAVAQNRLDQLRTHVALYQALGGAPADI